MKLMGLSAAAVTLVALSAGGVRAQGPLPDSAFLAQLEWRSIGPANMSGRITDIEGIGSPSKTYYVATVAGGIWKTTNNGTTFRPLFQHQRVVAMGDIAIAPSDTLQIWAGTGEEDSRNSISPGGGIYKSTDGGLTWTLMGLEKTQTVGRIVVDPTNPDIVYVAALGAIWNANPERGLYKTTDGGKTWKLIKFISDKAGFVDIAMDPRNPDVLYASSWERVRGPYFLNSGGPGSGLWKTMDGGATWTEIKGNGFPTAMKGRIGIAIAHSNPDIVYALVEAEKEADGSGGSGLYRSEDAGQSWTMMNDQDTRPFYYSQVRVDPQDPDRVYWSSTPFRFSTDGGKTVRNGTQGIHVDDHAMWIDPNDPDHFLVGNDGGIAQTWDRGGNFEFLNTIAIGQFYAVSYDMAVPYRVCGGLQDNGSWCGPSRKARGSITNHDWFTVGSGDGFWTAQDPRDPNIIYSESQGGSMGRLDYATGQRTSLRKPSWQEKYREYQDSIILLRGDTTQPVSSAVQKHIAELQKQASADSTALDLRYNWNTPLILSPHNPDVFYTAGNRVLKSTNKGEDLTPISPDLSAQDTMRIRVSTHTTGGITRDVTGAETYGTVVALAESPVKQGVLYAGTDDGNVWMTPDDGGKWVNLTGRFPGVPKMTWVTRIEPSHFDVNTFYVTFDNHREGDFTPYVYVTTDGGKHFQSLANNLPTGGPDYVHVIREDPYNRDLLFVGTDVGAYVSLNRGASWERFTAGLPTVPVRDLKIHPRDHELIAGTHGRSIWIVDIAPLEQWSPQVLAGTGHLFQPGPAFQYGQPPGANESTGQKWFEASSPSYGAEITYYLPGAAAAAAAPPTEAGNMPQAGGRGRQGGPGQARPQAQIIITDAQGDTVQTLTGPLSAGLHRVYWNFRGQPAPPEPLSPSERRDSVEALEHLDVVADSMIQAGAPRQVVERIVENIKSGNQSALGRSFRRGGGRFGGAATGWQDRPAESAPPRQGGRAGGPGGVDTQQITRDLMRSMRRGGRGGFGGFGGFGGRGRGGAPLADPGDYTVTLVVGDQTYTQKLHVERINNGGDSGFGFQEEEGNGRF